jgi:hypothetical protein
MVFELLSDHPLKKQDPAPFLYFRNMNYDHKLSIQLAGWLVGLLAH